MLGRAFARLRHHLRKCSAISSTVALVAISLHIVPTYRHLPLQNDETFKPPKTACRVLDKYAQTCPSVMFVMHHILVKAQSHTPWSL